MTLMLDVPPELEIRLREEAAREGMSAEAFARRLLEEQLLSSAQATQADQASPQERKRRLNAWIESNRGLPTLPEEAFQRSSFYGERG